MISDASVSFKLFMYEFPLWGIFLITLVIIFAGFEGGFLLGRRRSHRYGDKKDSPVGPMVAATLGLLAFMLTFTFGVAASHFNTRRHLVLDEANAIRSTYEMTQMLSAEATTDSRKLLCEYVDIRLEHIHSFEKLGKVILRSNEIQRTLWSIAMEDDAKGAGTPSAWLYIQSLSDMINLQAKRINYGAHGKIPLSIWIVLYWLAVLGMAAMGYHAGLIGMRGFFAYIVLILTFSGVIVLIYDLDRPKQQLFKVSQRALIDLREQMDKG